MTLALQDELLVREAAGPLTSTHVMDAVLDIVSQPMFSHLFQFSYELGTWSEDCQGWHEQQLYSLWLAPESSYDEARAHFAQVRQSIRALSYVSDVAVEAYLESRGYVDQYGECMGPLRGERWRIQFNCTVNYTHGRIYGARRQ